MRAPTRLPSAISLVWTAGFALGLGCGSAVFGCEDDVSCLEGGSSGVCQASGYCAFPDAECPSGLRYGAHAPVELASACVHEDADPSTGSTSDAGESTATTIANLEGGEVSTGDDSGSTGDDSVSTEDGSTSLEDSSGSSDDGSTSSDDGGAESAGEDSSTGEDVGPPCEAGWWDDFADDTLDRGWDLWTLADHELPLQSEGRVRMSLPATNDGWVGIVTEIGPMLDRSAGIEWSFDEFDPNAFAWFNVQSGSKYEFAVYYGMLEVRIGQDGEMSGIASVGFDPFEHRFVRIRSDDDLVHWDASSDGTRWTTLHSVPDTESSAAHTLEFGIGTWEPLTSGAGLDVHQAFRCP